MVFLLYSVLLSLLIGVRKFQSQPKQSFSYIKNDIFQESKCQTIPGLSFGDNHLKAFMGPEVRIFAQHVIKDRTISITDYSTLSFSSPSSYSCIPYHSFVPPERGGRGRVSFQPTTLLLWLDPTKFLKMA